MIRDKVIYCIGDSHVGFFSGSDELAPQWPAMSKDILPFFKTFHLGPILAYNLCKWKTKTKGREKLFSILRCDILPKSRIMLCFGEIDCRAHLLKQKEHQEKSEMQIVQDCAERYFSVASELKEKGHEVIIWNVIPSTQLTIGGKYPTYGSGADRIRITKLLNELIRQLCLSHDMKFISIFDDLLDQNGLPESNYYVDSIHLSQKALNLATKKLKEAMSDLDFTMPSGPVKNSNDGKTFINSLNLMRRRIVLLYYVFQAYAMNLRKII